MPAQRFGSTPLLIRQFDVVGKDSMGRPGFLGHVALAAVERASHAAFDALPVLHMRPPFDPSGECQADCVGSAMLTVEEQLQIRLFSEELESEYNAAQIRHSRDQYVICPHVKEISREDDTAAYLRFSCAGFVIEAYREADIDLLWTDLAHLPLVGLEVLKAQYPEFAGMLERPRIRDEFGVGGDGPWPVVLAGYVLNALDRSETEIRSTPYRATEGDEFFPPRTPAT